MEYNAKLDAALKALEPDMIDTLQRWIRVPSVRADKSAENAPFGAEVRRALDVAMADINRLGMNARDVDGYCCDAEIGEGEETLAVLAHLDVVPEGDGWDYDPYGAESVESWIQDYIGPGCTEEDFLSYMRTYYLGIGYLEELEKTTTFTAEEVDAYFTENEALYADSGITKESGKTVDVRHILLMPEGGETGADGYPVYTEEAWAACEAEAQKIYDEWKSGDMSEQSFADFAVKFSQDGNAYLGGI